MSTSDKLKQNGRSIFLIFSEFLKRKKLRRETKHISREFKRRAVKHFEAKTLLPDVEFLVYYGDMRSENHFDLWDPVFAESSRNYMSVFRYSASWWAKKDRENVLAAGSIDQVTPLIERMPNLKAIFYPANNGVNLQAIRNSSIRHIFLGHGDSDKASSANKIFRLYDEVWTAGQNHIDRFNHIEGSFSSIDFRIIGQPWMRRWLKILPEQDAASHSNWAYFPTWSGYFQNTNYSSLSQTEEISRTIYSVLGARGKGFLKLHPWTEEDEMGWFKETASSVSDKFTVVDKGSHLRTILLNELQFVVCDISGAVTECLYIDVPIFLYRPHSFIALSKNFAEENTFCYIFSTVDELGGLLKRVIIDGNDELSEVRKKFLEYRASITATKSNQFAKELERLSSES